MQNAEIARLFEELADLLEIQGANPFRLRAYRNAARTVEGLTEPIADLADEGPKALTELQGIGKNVAEKIIVICETGELKQLNEMREEVPAGVVMMLRIPGIGPKKVAALYKELNLETLDQLKEAAENGDVAKLKGFGQKTAETILEGLEHIEQAGLRVYLADAMPFVEEIVEDLSKCEAITQVTVAGSFRRRRESVGDLDVLATSTDSAAAMKALSEHRLVEKVLVQGDTKQRVRLSPVFDGSARLEMDLRVVPDESYGAAMQYFTGSKEHNIAVRRRALDRGLSVNEYAVTRDGEYVCGRTEEEVYAAVDLAWVPPELRENRGEIEAAERGDSDGGCLGREAGASRARERIQSRQRS